MRNIILLLICLTALLVCVRSQTAGHDEFYAEFTLTNDVWGVSASFHIKYWYSKPLKRIRMDYYQTAGGTKILTELYDYRTSNNTLFQICNGCNTTQLTQEQALLYVPNLTSFSQQSNCPAIGSYTALDTCSGTCTQYTHNNPPSIYGAEFLQFKSNQLCKVGFVDRSTEGRRVAHVTKYENSGFTNGNPTTTSIYNAALTGQNCPQPTCNANLDLVIVTDDSGSIDEDEYDSQVVFINNFVNRLSADSQISLVWFAGLDPVSCTRVPVPGPDWYRSPNRKYRPTGSSWEFDPSGDTPCYVEGGCGSSSTTKSYCGGLTNVVSRNFQTGATQLANLDNHNRVSCSNCFTCITCGLDAGEEAFLSASFGARLSDPTVTKAILLLTDGVQNRQTKKYDPSTDNDDDNYLKTVGERIVGTNGIIVFAVGVAGASQSQLELAAGGPNNNTDRVFRTSTFDYTLIEEELFKQVCTQSFPSLSPCSNPCLCACGTCTPPTCDDGNACFTSTPSSSTGTCNDPVPVVCTPPNLCLQPDCNNSTGCAYSDIPKPPYTTNNVCWDYTCNNGVWEAEGIDTCTQSTNLCHFDYCDSRFNGNAGGCNRIDITTIDYNQVITYFNSNNQTVTTSFRGCKPPTTALPCETYTCGPGRGECTYSDTNCVCKVDSDCLQTNGCEKYICNTTSNACELSSKVDCWFELSNGGCSINAATTGSTYYPSVDILYGNVTFGTKFNKNGTTDNPDDTISKTCPEMACFDGEPSEYVCVPNGLAHTCQRQKSQCNPTGCQDNICVWSTWSNNQLQSSCVDTFAPTCTNSSVCFDSTCVASAPANGQRCVNFPALSCDDGNPCTQNICNDVSGCQYPPINQPTPNNTCTEYQCQGGSFVPVDVGVANCNSGDLCIIGYCDESDNNQCKNVSRMSLDTTQSVVIVDSLGNSRTITGCAKPTGSPACFVYSCNSATGECEIDTSTCMCVTNADCDDGNSCTQESCVTNACVTTGTTDCYNVVSNGNCNVNTAFTGSIQPSLNLLYQNQTFGNLFDVIPGTINPQINIDRSCEQVGCFNGQRSTYTCDGTGATPVCVRTIDSCSPNGCKDDICRTTGNWVNGQIQTECSVVFEPDCANDNNVCVDSACNITAGPNDNRCIVTGPSALSQSCNDGNPCTTDSCLPLTGCDYSWLSPTPGLTNDTCSLYECVGGNFPRQDLGVAACTPPADMCVFNFCNTTQGNCQTIDIRTIPFGTTVTVADSAGTNFFLEGCARPTTALPCDQFICSPNYKCIENRSTCVCRVDADCADGDGCTINTCNTQTNQCEKTTRDCFDVLSNGQCSVSKPIAASDALGKSFFDKSVTVTNQVGNPDTNGNPVTGVNRTCEILACFNGQRNEYRCTSTSETDFVCERSFKNCDSLSCTDRYCQNSATWVTTSDGSIQIGTSCKNEDVTCLPDNACVTASCNTSYSFADDADTYRCIQTTSQIDILCNDGDKCTADLCDKTSTGGCRGGNSTHPPVCAFCRNPEYNQTYIDTVLCKDAPLCNSAKCEGNQCKFTPLNCPAMNTNCFIFYCNASTNNECVRIENEFVKVDKCGVCGGDGSTCREDTGTQKKKSILAAVLLGVLIPCAIAAILAAVGLQRGYSKYQEIADQGTGAVKPNPGYKGNQGGQNPGLRASAIGNQN